MGLLSDSRVPGTVALLLLTAVVGCTAFEAILPDDGPSRSFDHRVHVVDEELECFMCHIGAEDLDEPGMPNVGQCRLCHDEPESEDEPDLTAGFFDAEGEYAHRPFSALADEVVFSHLAHVEAELDCVACHGDVTADPRLDASVGVSMSECVACHDSSAAPNECATCHSEVGPEWAPRSHANGWTRAHGPVSLERDGATANDCSLCHAEASCTSCHLENPPQSHTNYWRRRGHGASAALDRTACMTCHKRDACVECHSQVQPASHRGQWGGRRSTHCNGCHLGALAEDGCAVCHQGAPSHAFATPLPPDHVPSMNCRQCHGAGVRLPHVDNGDSCIACHK